MYTCALGDNLSTFIVKYLRKNFFFFSHSVIYLFLAIWIPFCSCYVRLFMFYTLSVAFRSQWGIYTISQIQLHMYFTITPRVCHWTLLQNLLHSSPPPRLSCSSHVHGSVFSQRLILSWQVTVCVFKMTCRSAEFRKVQSSQPHHAGSCARHWLAFLLPQGVKSVWHSLCFCQCVPACLLLCRTNCEELWLLLRQWKWV